MSFKSQDEPVLLWLTSTELLKTPSVDRSSISCGSLRYQWHVLSSWYMRLQLALIACQRADWRSARDHLDKLETGSKDAAFEPDDDTNKWLQYLQGTIAQATGDFETALSIFQSSIFALPTNATQSNDAQTDLCVLAALNTLLFIRSPRHHQHKLYADLLAQLEPLCLQHPNKSIHSAFYLMRAISPRTDATNIVKVKQHLQQALQDAKVVANQQLLTISLNFMTALFFKDIVGEQAEKSARTGLFLARKGNSQLWTCVANGMLANTLERCGKGEEAASVRHDAERAVPSLPEPLADLCWGGQDA